MYEGRVHVYYHCKSILGTISTKIVLIHFVELGKFVVVSVLLQGVPLDFVL